MVTIKEVEDNIRDLINFVQVKNGEELEAAEGKKIETDTAEELKTKLRDLAGLVGQVQ